MADAEKRVDEGKPKPGGTSRARVIGARALTVVAVLLELVGMLAYYMLVGVWFVETPLAQLVRVGPPTLENRATTDGRAAVALLALVLVAPQPTRGWPPAALLIGLAIAGIEVVRSIVQRDLWSG